MSLGSSTRFPRQHLYSNDVFIGNEVDFPRHSSRQFVGNDDHVPGHKNEVRVRDSQALAVRQVKAKRLERLGMDQVANVLRFHSPQCSGSRNILQPLDAGTMVPTWSWPVADAACKGRGDPSDGGGRICRYEIPLG